MKKNSDELLENILGISVLVFLLKGGRLFILLMFIFYFLVKWMEKEEEEEQIRQNEKDLEEIRKRKGLK